MHLFIGIVVLGFIVTPARSIERPHIIIILADDLGWNDVSFHGSPQIPTPNIDALASSSIVLHNYYTQPLCSQSRGSLLSGKYPTRLGLQNNGIVEGTRTGLPLDVVLMPQHLKTLGYATHMVGKWNLGYFKKEYTPTFRGFDSFFGFYNGYLDYYDYTFCKKPVTWGVDLHDGTETIKDFRGEYATEVFTQKGVDIIERQDPTEPLFLYMSYSACHTGNIYIKPLQAPSEFIAKHSYIKDKKRRTYAGMVSALDASIGKIFEALEKKSMLNDTIIVFSSDNGGESDEEMGGVGSNWPLRGMKGYLWEGGIRVPAFVWSPLLSLEDPVVSTQLMHISDWLPTLYAAAGGDIQDLGVIDGFSMLEAWINNLQSPRTSLLHNIDPITGISALRRGDYKLINGTLPTTNQNGWTGSSGRENINLSILMDEYVFKDGSIVKDILEASGWWLPKMPDVWRTNLSVQCKQPPPTENERCDPVKWPCLFNVVADPCEYSNLALKYPRIVRTMMLTIQRYAEQAVEPQIQPFDAQSDPRCHGFAHVSWMDEEYSSNCLNL